MTAPLAASDDAEAAAVEPAAAAAAGDGVGSGGSSSSDAGAELVAAAEERLTAGDPGGCLALLAAAPQSLQRQCLPLRQLQALCHIQLAGSAASASGGGWWQVLGLAPETATPEAVRRQYKRLAALVHPDKCGRLGGAAQAAAGQGFQRLQAAAGKLLDSLEGGGGGGGSGGGGNPARKRSRADAGGDIGLDGEEEDEAGSAGWAPDGGGFPWWDAWDDAVPPPGGSRPARQPQPQGFVADRDAEEEGGQGQLQRLSLDELRGEVRRRQAVLLEPPPRDAKGRPVPLAQLQAALGRARTALAARLAAAAATAAHRDGGFLRHGLD